MTRTVVRALVAVGLGVVLAYVGAVMREEGSDLAQGVIGLGVLLLVLGAVFLVQERLRPSGDRHEPKPATRRPWDQP